jgi:hypothetical protein
MVIQERAVVVGSPCLGLTAVACRCMPVRASAWGRVPSERLLERRILHGVRCVVGMGTQNGRVTQNAEVRTMPGACVPRYGIMSENYLEFEFRISDLGVLSPFYLFGLILPLITSRADEVTRSACKDEGFTSQQCQQLPLRTNETTLLYALLSVLFPSNHQTERRKYTEQ